MADLFGIVTQLAGLQSLADVIVHKGSKCIKDIKKAKELLTGLVEEVNNLSGVLHSLHNVVQRLEEDGGTLDPTTRINYIESCYKTLDEIHDKFNEDMTTIPNSRHGLMQSLFEESHTKRLLLDIEKYKTTAILALTAGKMRVQFPFLILY